jgi:hypothetical protein
MAFFTHRELVRFGVAGGSGLGDVVVDAAGAAFLQTVPATLATLQSMAKSIGPPSPFLMTKSYGDSWDPWFDLWRSTYDRGIAVLPENSEARTTFISTMSSINKSANRIRQGDGALWQAFLDTITGNPLAVLKYAVGRNLLATVKDVVDAGKDVYAPQLDWLAWLWALRAATPTATSWGANESAAKPPTTHHLWSQSHASQSSCGA